MHALDFSLVTNTPYHFYAPLIIIAGYDHKKSCLGQYVLELALLDHSFLKYRPSVLASATVYLINKIKRSEIAWPDSLMAASGYSEA